MTLDSRSKYKQSHEYSNVCALHEKPVLLAVISRKICIRCDVELCAAPWARATKNVKKPQSQM